MPEELPVKRQLTELDFSRLKRLAGARLQSRLAEVLLSADVLPSRRIRPDVVTMYSQVEVEEAGTGRRRILVPCYPPDSEPEEGYVAILSREGLALLGLHVGATARWTPPTGEQVAALIVAVHFQPEASGDYVT